MKTVAVTMVKDEDDVIETTVRHMLTQVETVIVAGKVRKWNGKLRNVTLVQLRNQLEDSRDYIFARAGIPQDIFRKN